jgi:hypothetical protein
MKHCKHLSAARVLFALVPVMAICCAGYSMMLPGDLEYKKCRTRNSDAGIAVSASKQPLYETRNNRVYRASLKQRVGVFAVKIENTGMRPLCVDSAHIVILDGTGNSAGILTNAAGVSQRLGGGEPLQTDLASYPLWGKTLEPGKSYCAFICVAAPADPYFATYFLRFLGGSGEILTEVRF